MAYRGKIFLLLLLAAAFAFTACGRSRPDRLAFEGVYFRGDVDKIDRQRDQFEVKVSPVSASLNGARQAARYEATRYCIRNFGTSRVDWENSPDAEISRLRIENDRLSLNGRCVEDY